MRRGERWMLCGAWGLWVSGGFWALVACYTLFVGRHWPAGGGNAVLWAKEREFLWVVAFFYGVDRVLRYHPLCHPGYRRWLEGTPWRSPASLPLGPVHLVWRDLLFLGPLAALAALTPGARAVEPLAVFGVAYLLALAASLRRARWHAFALVAALAGLLRARPGVEWVTAALVPLYALAGCGLRCSMRAFPWAKDNRPEDVAGRLGWPFADLAPVRSGRASPWWHAPAYAALAGWLLYCVLTREYCGRPDGYAATYIGLVGGVTALFRWGAFVGALDAPSSLAGRRASGRWVVPSFDRAYVAPAVIAAVAAALPWALMADGRMDVPAIAGVCTGVYILLALLLPPSLSAWRLTAEGRVRFAPQDGRLNYVSTG